MSNESENKGVYEHDVYVRSMEGNIRDSEELAELVIINSVNQKEYVFSVWGDGDDFDNEKVKEEGLGSLVWLSGVNENITLDVDREELETDLNNVLFQSSLEDLLKDEAMQEVTNRIVDYQDDDKEFIYKVPFNQLSKDMRTVLIDEEITRMTRLAHEKGLEKEDIINFGKLIGQDTDISVGQLNYLKEPMELALSDGVLSPHEKQAIQFTFEAFQLEQPELERTKEQEKIKKQVNKEVEYELER
jgi:hypothetical protein